MLLQFKEHTIQHIMELTAIIHFTNQHFLTTSHM